MNAINRWFFSPVPLGRVAAIRTLAYLFIPVDLLLTTRWALDHKSVSTDLYQPLWLARELPIVPTPTHAVVVGLCIALLVVSVAAAFNRAPRILGAAVFVLYFEWVMIAMAYGKVDHDRIGYLVLFGGRPIIGMARWATRPRCAGSRLGHARHADRGGVHVLSGGVGEAPVRRHRMAQRVHTVICGAAARDLDDNWLLEFPILLVIGQYLMMGLELLSPLILFIRRDRTRYLTVAGLYGFHVMTFCAITIVFLPHLVALAAFLPMDKSPARFSGPRRSSPARLADQTDSADGKQGGAEPSDAETDAGADRNEPRPSPPRRQPASNPASSYRRTAVPCHERDKKATKSYERDTTAHFRH